MGDTPKTLSTLTLAGETLQITAFVTSYFGCSSGLKKRQQDLRGGGESVEDNGRSGGLKDATADENVKIVHTLSMCDSR